MNPLRVGIVGAGNISSIYCDNLTKFPSTELVAISDLDDARAKAQADKYGIRTLSVNDLIASPDVDLILNITIPVAHGEVAIKALQAGKHVYNEKPLAIGRDDCQQCSSLHPKRGFGSGAHQTRFSAQVTREFAK